jgi:hypothetical protein
MEKEFVPYDRALKLKQLGFDEPCFGIYTVSNKKLFIVTPSKDESFGYLNTPTFSQAFRFFREKYDLHYLRPTKYSETKWWGIGGNTKVCDSYEEAELACLNKLIEIVEGRES